MTSQNIRNRLDAAAAVAMILASAVVVYLNVARSSPAGPPRKEVSVPTELQVLDGAQIRGNVNARVAIIEYSDFQCPYCGKFALGALKTLEKEYIDSGRVLLAFRHLPLGIHQHARKAGEAAECAARQGRFWQMHDRLFADQKSLDEPTLLAAGVAIGIDRQTFAACLAGGTADKVEADAVNAAKLGLTGTPAFLIGAVQPKGGVKVTDVITGAKSIGAFRTVLDNLLKADR